MGDQKFADRDLDHEIVQIGAPVLPTEAHKRIPDRLWLRAAAVRSNGALRASFSIPGSGRPARFAELMEVQRQAGIVHVHQHLGVPHDDAFILNSIELSVERPEVSSSTSDTRGMIEVELVDVVRTNTRIKSSTQAFRVQSSDGLRAHGSATASFIPKVVYDRLRGHAMLTIVPPAQTTVSRRGKTRRELLIVDHADPILSDHRADHVSAMSVVSTIERLTTDGGRAGQVEALSLQFASYAELEPAPIIEVHVDSALAFTGSLEQEDITRATFDGILGSTSPQMKRTP